MVDPSKLSVPQLVLVVLTLSVVGGVVAAANTSAAPFSAYNSGWEGSDELRSVAAAEGVEVQTPHDATTYEQLSPDGTVAFVLAPDSRYRADDVARVSEFVRSGGTLVVADDYGPHANELLQQLGASARLDGRPVRDVRSNYRSSAMPVASPVADHQFVAGVESVTLNHGTVVEPGEATPLVNTSEHAYVDADWNGGLGPNETLETHTVATVERVGEGQVVVVGDASVFINAMVERPGNRNFVRALLSGRGTVVLDHSHAADLPPAVLAVIVVRESAALQFGLGTLAVGALAVWSRRPGLVRSRMSSLISGRLSGLGSGRTFGLLRSDDAVLQPSSDSRPSTSELAAHLEREHPDWDRERVERVVSALERRRDR